MTYNSPKEITRLLEGRGLAMKKRFGQNFLVSPGVRRKILSLLGPTLEETVWEIGAGIGSMTHMIVEAVARVVAFEIDYGFVRVLRDELGELNNLQIVAGDYLERWNDAYETFGHPDAIFGNLPYRVAATLIGTLAEWERPVRKAVFTVQREVARRMAAAPATKDYSAFSLICQSVFDVKLHGDVAPAAFYPVPEVTSTIVGLAPKGETASLNRTLFRAVVRDLFASRRKTIRNNLASGAACSRVSADRIEFALRAASIDPAARGEELSVDDVVAFVTALEAE